MIRIIGLKEEATPRGSFFIKMKLYKYTTNP